MVQRITYRRRLYYNTRSNKRRVIKTPGNRLVYLYKKKLGSIPSCGDCKEKLKGVSRFSISTNSCFASRLYPNIGDRTRCLILRWSTKFFLQQDLERI